MYVNDTINKKFIFDFSNDILSAIYQLLKIIILITSLITANIGYFFSHLFFYEYFKIIQYNINIKFSNKKQEQKI